MDMHEAFVRDIHANPTDPAPRLIYADWLQERGDAQSLARAELLRLEVAAADAKPAARRKMEARIGELRRTIDPGWLALLAKLPIAGCRIEFEFECPKRWELVQFTANPRVRFCETCQNQVYYCDSAAQALRHARQGHCLALDWGRATGGVPFRGQAHGPRRMGRVRTHRPH